ncbi:hypothetical protein GJ496_001180 [Pomphorhynchus laevis]|nr:hypothetical protein GJ496_001180 [Pomphorhynchus laevis]
MNITDLKVIKCLGLGRFGHHELLAYSSSFSRYRYRLVYIDLEKVDDIDKLYLTVRTNRLMRHENLLPLLNVVLLKSSNALVFGSPLFVCDCDQLFHVIQKAALSYLHQQYIIHRAVQLCNICVTENGHVYLRGLEHCIYQMNEEKVLRSVHHMDEFFEECIPYASPNILLQGGYGYTVNSDLYSVAVVACELANGVRMFSNNCSLIQIFYEKIIGSSIPLLWDRTLIHKLSAKLTSSREDLVFTNCLLHSDVWLKIARTKKFSSAFHNFIKKCIIANKMHCATHLLNHQFFSKANPRLSDSLLMILDQFHRLCTKAYVDNNVLCEEPSCCTVEISKRLLQSDEIKVSELVTDEVTNDEFVYLK